MHDYEPVDLAQYFNAGVYRPLLELGAPKRLGHQLLKGLPFKLGSDLQKFCLVPSVLPLPTRIEVGRKVQSVIVAHRQLGFSSSDRDEVGRHVADYVFHLGGGEHLTVPIRQRFEIDTVPGRFPFVAVPDQSDSLFQRDIRIVRAGWYPPVRVSLWRGSGLLPMGMA